MADRSLHQETPSAQAARQGSGLRPFQSLQGYRAAWLAGDISAGLSVAAVSLPTAIAYPAIAIVIAIVLATVAIAMIVVLIRLLRRLKRPKTG